jgi:hypothetical protein
VSITAQGEDTGEFCNSKVTENTTWPAEHKPFGLTTLVEPRSHWSNGSHYIYAATVPSGLGRWAQPIGADVEVPNAATLEHIAAEVYEDPVQQPYNMTEYGCVYYSASWFLKYPP